MMSSALTFLRHSLLRHNSDVSFGATFDPKKLDDELINLKRYITVGPAKPADDLIIRALADFYQSPVLNNYRQARLVSHGFTSAWGPQNYRLIEDVARFPRLLDGLDAFKPKPRAFRHCYRSLLRGYFSYNPDAADSKMSGKTNWEALRQYLGISRQHTQVSGIEPEWSDALNKHINLLTANPCSRYSKAMLDGDSAEFEWAKSKLEITDSSWLTEQVVLSQVKLAVAQGDTTFSKNLVPLLDLLEKHPRLINHGLPVILDRYGMCQPVILSPELRDYSVGCWGNPVFKNNQIHWSLVTEQTRDMIANWLKLYLIHQFFSLLAEDKTNDARRLMFWQRYYKNIEGIHFVLGNTAHYSARQDFKRIREEAKGLILGLHSAGSPDNNAFIITFRNHVIVEFGMAGSACFAFKRETLPFVLSGHLAGNSSGLKHDSNVMRLIHRDTNYEDWEARFESHLAPILGCRPGNIADLPLGVATQTTRRPVRVPIGPTSASIANPSGPISQDSQSDLIADLPFAVPTLGPHRPGIVAPPSGTAAAKPPAPHTADLPFAIPTLTAVRPGIVAPALGAVATSPPATHATMPAPPVVASASAPVVVLPVTPVNIKDGTEHKTELQLWCGRHGFKMDDLRIQGGNLWIETGNSDWEVNRQLRFWGFYFKEGKGWWRKK